MAIKLKGKNMKIIPYTRLGGIIPQHHLTLVTGLPATGKSFTVLKFLNSIGVKPFLFNLDYDPTLQQFELLGSTADPEHLSAFMQGEVEDLNGEVIVIDTYTRMVSDLRLSNSDENQRQISDNLIKLCQDKKYTIIVIGHVEPYATRSNIFKDNLYLPRDCHEQLHFDRVEDKDRKTGSITVNYRTTIVKNRGSSTDTVIMDNWLR